MSAAEKTALMGEVARQRALEHPLAAIHGARLFHVDQPWQEEALAQLEDVVTVHTLAELETWLQEDESVLLVPARTGITRDAIDHLLQRSSARADIFIAG